MTSTRTPIVVGYDGSPGAELALDWAADEARVRKAPLRIVYAASFLPETDDLRAPGGVPATAQDQGRKHALALVQAAAERAAHRSPDIAITTSAVEGVGAARELVAESLTASMVVVGSRRLGALGSAFLGSVGSAISQRSGCPVVVVRGPAGDPAEGARVIVGIDARAPSDGSLDFAFDHAAAHDIELEAVLCWHPDLLAQMKWRPEQPAPEQADALLAEAVAGWREKYPNVRARASVVRNYPAAGLVEASTAQHLLVVGRHGPHSLPGVVLGSTSMGVLHHATCPVAIVPEI